MKWNLRWVAARRDIWRPTQLQAAFAEVGFTPSLSKVVALWSNKPTTLRLEDLDKICAALGCTVADLLEAEPEHHQSERDLSRVRSAGAQGETGGVRPVPRGTGGGAPRRGLPPN